MNRFSILAANLAVAVLTASRAFAQPFDVKGSDSKWQSQPLPQAVRDTLQKFAP